MPTFNIPAEMTNLDLEAQLSDPMPHRLNKEQASQAESQHQNAKYREVPFLRVWIKLRGTTVIPSRYSIPIASQAL
jgi:hypothetical protein